jgi:hypothetical protein
VGSVKLIAAPAVGAVTANRESRLNSMSIWLVTCGLMPEVGN